MNSSHSSIARVIVTGLLTSSVGLGASLVAHRSVEELTAGVPGASALAKAHRVIVFSDGSRFAIHREANTWEKGAIGATLIRSDGSTKTFWAENFVPEGVVQDERPAARTVGQIYGASLFPDGDTLAVSIGWVDPIGRSHNAIAIRSLTKGLQNLIEFDGTIRDVIAGPGAVLLAVTYLPERASDAKGSPLVIALDTRGNVHGEFLQLPVGIDTKTIGQTINTARLEGWRAGRFTLYRDTDPSVSFLELSVPPSLAERKPTPGLTKWPVRAKFVQDGHVELSVKRSVPLPDPNLTPESRALTSAVHTEEDGSITLVRSYAGLHPHTVVLHYTNGAAAPTTWSPATPWRAAYWAAGSLVGIAEQANSTILESVRLEK